MKILKDNFNNINKNIDNPVPKIIACSRCGSELEYEAKDMKEGAFGCMYLNCPLCGEDNFLDEEEGVVLTANNVQFPTHFYHISKEAGALDCCNNREVVVAIKKAIEYFRNNKNASDWYYQTGNLHVNVSRFEGDEMYNVIVTNDYYETEIDFEPEDY